jgi:hypothetical protein
LNDTVEIIGLSPLIQTSENGELRVWRPGRGGALPEPENFELLLRHEGQEYRAVMARTVQGIRLLGEEDQAELQRWEGWFRRIPGWWVKVFRPGGGSFDARDSGYSSAPYPTLEAAIVGALTIPPVIVRGHPGMGNEPESGD